MPPCLCRRNKRMLAQSENAEMRVSWRVTAEATHPAEALATLELAAHHRMETISSCP
jgi:hypothetical protein